MTHDDLVQLLDPSGQVLSHPDFHAQLSEAQLLQAYRDMALARELDTTATALQRQGELGLWAPLLGQEASQIGAAYALTPADYCFPTYREHGMALVAGVAAQDALKLFRGVSHGGWDAEEHRFGLYTIVLADQVPHAVGYAMGMQRDQERAAQAGKPVDPGAVLVFFGDGASSQGDVHEAMVFASVFRAPVVFLCQNNQWAISEPVSRQSPVPLVQRAHGYGMPGQRVDGNDVLGMHAAVSQALERARNGEGPQFIEAFTYRRGAHTTADDPTRYRDKAEEAQWEEKDPLLRLGRYLEHINPAAFAELKTELVTEGAALADQVRAEVRGMDLTDPAVLFEHIYVDPHPLVTQEQREYEEYLAGFADESEA